MSTKTAYQFDYAGLYAGETVADESPMEPGVYLLPARCTLTPPPADVPADKWPRFTGNAWQLVTRPQPAPESPAQDPVAKLQAFLAQNPDVAALLGNTPG